jgi:hypothetical protein
LSPSRSARPQTRPRRTACSYALLALATVAVVLTAVPAHGGGTAPPVASATAAAAGNARAEGCLLFHRGAEDADPARCLACHSATGAGNHPVGIAYDEARARRGPTLRAGAEVVRRGVFLKEGKVTCLTCHDARSPWKFRIALPPGAEIDEIPANPAVDPPILPRSRGTPGPGSLVSPVPLCVSCHALD